MFEVVRGRTKLILAAFRRSPPPSKGGTHIFTCIIPFFQKVHIGRNKRCYTMPGEILTSFCEGSVAMPNTWKCTF